MGVNWTGEEEEAQSLVEVEDDRVHKVMQMLAEKTRDWEILETRVGNLERWQGSLAHPEYPHSPLTAWLILADEIQEWSRIPCPSHLRVVLSAQYSKEKGAIVYRTQRKQLPSRYGEKLAAIEGAFKELEADFDDPQHRIVRCDDLEQALADMEDYLDELDAEHLQWCVATMCDALKYSYAEQMTPKQLQSLKQVLAIIQNKSTTLALEDYEQSHQSLLESGFCLLPNSQKAIDKYGE